MSAEMHVMFAIRGTLPARPVLQGVCPMTDPIFVECSQCEGYGAIVVPSRQFHSKWDTDPPEYYNEEEPCPTCGGTGKEEIQGEPITLDDIVSIPTL